jgi:hypothetical protein
MTLDLSADELAALVSAMQEALDERDRETIRAAAPVIVKAAIEAYRKWLAEQGLPRTVKRVQRDELGRITSVIEHREMDV